MARHFHQGTYDVINKDKYIGASNPTYRSSWEREVFIFFDKNPNVIKWGAEVIVVPYWSRVDSKPRRYYVDCYVEYRDRTGSVQKELVEIKPKSQTQPPSKRGKKKKTYLYEVEQYNVNIDKWRAASKYAKERGWKFRILTEKGIFK